MKYDVQEHLKPRELTGISDEQIEQHWHPYEAYVKNTNELLEEIETAEHGSRVWGELKRRLGFEFKAFVENVSWEIVEQRFKDSANRMAPARG